MNRVATSRCALSQLALTASTRIVWLRTSGASSPLTTTRSSPLWSLSRNTGADDQPRSIWPDMTWVSTAVGEPAGMRLTLTPKYLASAPETRSVDEPGRENAIVLPLASLKVLIGL